MKKLIACLACLLMYGFIGGAIAAPPGKSNILHCGCAVDAEGSLAMAYVNANVSNRAKGHARHVAGSIDSCFDGVDTYVDFERTGNDCLISGSLPGLESCAAQVAGDICGQPSAQ